MADLEDVQLDGRPLQSLRVADLKAALEERGLPKSGQKNTLVKRLKGALMLENLQRTSHHHIGLQPNSQIGEEMSQNSFIKQYLAKQQELLRQRLEREAREAVDDDDDTDKEDHTRDNNRSACAAPDQDVTPVFVDQHKLLGPSGGEGLAGPASEREGHVSRDGHVSAPPAPTSALGSLAVRVAGGEQRPERVPTSSQVPADSYGDGADEDWDSGARRRNLSEPPRGQLARARSGGSRQHPQHIPPLLSPQLRQPTPPPSPPPELSFPLPDTPKQSPPSPGEPPARQRTSSTSSSGSSSSGSCSSSPDPQSNTERKPGPLTLLARKMASEGAFSGVGWHGRGDAERQDNNAATATMSSGRGPQEGTVSAITHTTNAAASLPFPRLVPVTNQGVLGCHLPHSEVPVSVLRPTIMEERGAAWQQENKGKELQAESEREKSLEQERLSAVEQERLERQRIFEQQRAVEQEREGSLERERKEREKALEQERKERALERERAQALEREEEEREKALAKERDKREKAMQLEKQRAMEREQALEQERAKGKALEREREEKEKALERERERKEKALEREREEKEKALERERERKEKALERERKEKALVLERMERVKVLELEQQKALEREKEREEKVRALEQEIIEREKALEKERTMEKEREERERALEQEKVLQREKEESERALEQEKALQREREERERALEQEKALQREKEEREKALEQEKALQREKEERERALEQEKALQREKEERERALEQEKALQRGKEEREKALEQEKALQREKEERVLEQEKERAERERVSHLPPWKRSREIGLTPLPTPPLSTGAGKMAATEEGGEPIVPSLPQTALRDNQPAESGTPLSQSLATSQSPQSSFKKFRFLRDPIVLSQSSASGVLKRPRTFSESPHPQSLALQSPSKPGEPEQEGTQQGAQPSTGQAAPKKPARQGVLVSGADTSGTTAPERETPGIATPGKSPEEEKGKSLVSEEHVQAHREETDKQAVGETAREANAPSGPAGAVLPPSPQPVEGKVEKGRERSQKKEEKQGRRSSSSNDSSDSDSGSTSSGSSGSSSSSQGKTHTTPSGRRPEKPQTNTISQDKETVSQPEDPTEAPKAPQHKKRVSGEEEEDITIDGARHRKKPFLGIHAGEDNGHKDSEGEEVKTDTTREVNEAAMAEPKRAPESSEECETPKAFTGRRISLSGSKASPGAVSAEGETESGAGRKRRWGSSTVVTAKKSSMSITTDSLKSLIPDIRLCPGQEVVVDLHPEEDHLSGVEAEGRERAEQDLKIRRTVTQVVPSVTQENGQKESKRSEHEEEDREAGGEVKRDREETMDGSFQRDSLETQCPSLPSHDMEMKTVTPSDTLIRRSISQQKSGVSITIDDPVRTAKQSSPPRGKVSNIVHVSNLVRPFTLGQLKELLGRTGTVLENGFWINKIKSHCYVTYSSAEESIATRAALHGVKWPQSNPKFLSLDFIQQEELDFHRGLPPPERAGEGERGAAAVPGRGVALPPLLPEREQWAEREREMEHRERTRAEREWDRDKVRDFGPGKPGEEAGPRRSRSRERKRKERKMDKKEKAADEPPVKLLDDLFNKTKAAPCIYWLPLTEEQFAQKETARQERMKRRKEQQEEVEKKREEERKERMKAASGERGEGERYREQERDWGRDGESNKHREDVYRRSGGSSAGGGRRSRSRSDPPPRDRRR